MIPCRVCPERRGRLFREAAPVLEGFEDIREDPGSRVERDVSHLDKGRAREIDDLAVFGSMTSHDFILRAFTHAGHVVFSSGFDGRLRSILLCI
jgi:hypothetical protein